MPNLFKYIIKYSTPFGKQTISPSLPTTLSPQQIEEARMHPNTIILHALNALAIIQNAINTTNGKIDELIKQRDIIENTMITLLSLENQG